ncbi:hypothetical protein ACQKP0_13315 [Heyndrickxia sp. NPDC080065]|uniref:hypothetical protein n=1 Tax=Heyndrickxia sp. NPDC080065 TaxID=3390568 RepID=UPI003D06CE78
MNLLSELKKITMRLIEIVTILVIGLLFTINILKPTYEGFGIQFIGNVWINWFAVSYILFVIYTLILGLFIFKGSILFNFRLKSALFWLFFIVSNYVVFIPFIMGENPF